MITNNSSGTALSTSYASVVQDDSRSFLAKLFIGTTEIDCAIKKIEILKGSCGSSTEFSVGNLISSTLKAELMELNADVKGQRVEVRIGLDIDGYEWVTLGFFKISEVKGTSYRTTITGHGRIVSDSTGEFTAPSEPTLANIATSIGSGLGCSVTFDTGIDTSLTITESMDGLTNYQALQILASVVGGYAIDTYDGNVKICRFNMTPTVSVNSGMMKTLPNIEEKDFEITGVSCDSFTQGTVNLPMSNKFVTQDLFNAMASSLIGYKYRPATIDLSLGDPRLEGNDVLSVTDSNGAVYVVPCHILRHIYDGGFSTKIESVRATNLADNIGTVTPLQDVKYTAEYASKIASNTNQYFWFTQSGDDTGAHISEIPQNEFIANPSGGNLLARSNGVAVRDGVRVLASFGETVRIGTSPRIEITSEGLGLFLQSYINRPAFSIGINASDTATNVFTGDGVTKTFHIGSIPVEPNIVVEVDGTVTDYTYVRDAANFRGRVILATAPPVGSIISITHAVLDLPRFLFGGTATGYYAFSEGVGAVASDICTHAEGYSTEAKASYAHSQNLGTKASSMAQTAVGKYNVEDANGEYAFIIGNGTASARSDAFAVTWDGDILIADDTAISTALSTLGW